MLASMTYVYSGYRKLLPKMESTTQEIRSNETGMCIWHPDLPVATQNQTKARCLQGVEETGQLGYEMF